MAVEAKIISLSVDDRVDEALRHSMDIYMNKLASGFIEIGLENTFQMSLASLIQNELDQHTYCDDERFIVKFEKNMPINGNNDYIDIVVEYKKGQTIKLYPIELKFKKVSDGGLVVGNIESYKDIYNLDCHKQNTANVSACYFIFLTDNDAYLKQSTAGTRTEVPMYDGYTIQANHNYRVTGYAAIKSTSKYPSGFIFSADYPISYQHMNMPRVNTPRKDYWFFIVRI